MDHLPLTHAHARIRYKLACLTAILIFMLPAVSVQSITALAADQTSSPDPIVAGMVAQVDPETVVAYEGGLSGEQPVMIGGEPYTIATRYTYNESAIQKAAQYAYEHLQSLGLDTSYQDYQFFSSTRSNVVAEQTGLGQPDRVFLLTAHLDDNPSPTFAPGADDNASGVTAVMIAADILSRYHFDCTLRYILFTGEEQGLLGSKAYASQALQNGDNIEGVLNLDMIAYNQTGSAPGIDLHTRNGVADDLSIASLFEDSISAYSLSLEPEVIQDSIQASDHASFWAKGYPGILAIEDDDDFNPYYHKDEDQLDKLDIQYFTDFTKAAVATFAQMGCLLDQPAYIQGLVRDAKTNAPLTGVEVRATAENGLRFTAVSDADGIYTLAVQSGVYTVEAGREGYPDEVIRDISVDELNTTSLDFLLQPVPAIRVSPSNLELTLQHNDMKNSKLTLTCLSSSELDWSLSEDPEVDWLGTDINSGTIISDTQDIYITVTSTMTEPGIYQANLKINSNDPDDPVVTVPVILHMLGYPIYFPLIWHFTE